MKKWIWLLVIVGFLQSLYAQIGHIIEIKGDVKINRFDVDLNASKDYPVILKKDENNSLIPVEIFKKDIIFTADNSRAKVKFVDNTIIMIGKYSEFNIENYFYETNNTDSELGVKFVKGAFRSITGQIGKVAPKRFKLSTRTSTIGIRGTEILGLLGEGLDKVACTDGELSVGAADGTGEVSVKAGQITQVAKGAAPEPAREYTPDELTEMLDSAGEVDEAVRAGLGVAPFVEDNATQIMDVNVTAMDNNVTLSDVNMTNIGTQKVNDLNISRKNLEKIYKF